MKESKKKSINYENGLEGIICVAEFGLSVIALAIRHTPVPELAHVTFQCQIIGFAASQDPRIPH